MKAIIATMAAVLAIPHLLLSQTSSTRQQLPPGFVDGSKNPELIPDHVSYRLVLLSLALPALAYPRAGSRQSAALVRIGLSESDVQAIKPLIDAFSGRHSQWLAAIGVRHDYASEQQVRALVLSTRDTILKALTPDGASKLVQYVEREKAHMIAKP